MSTPLGYLKVSLRVRVARDFDFVKRKFNGATICRKQKETEMHTLTDDKAIADMKEFISGPTQGISFVLAMQQGTSIEIVRREAQPCYGEMRPYEETHPAEVNDGVEKPGDLDDPFPDGTPLAIGFRFSQRVNKDSPDGRLVEFLCSPTLSPFRNVLDFTNDVQLIETGGMYAGVLHLNTKVNSDYIFHHAQLLRDSVGSYSTTTKLWERFINAGIEPRLAYVLTHMVMVFNNEMLALNMAPTYIFSNTPYVPAVINGTPEPLEKNWDFYDRKPYHRDESGNVLDMWCKPVKQSIVHHPAFHTQSYYKVATFETIVKEVVPAVEAFANGG